MFGYVWFAIYHYEYCLYVQEVPLGPSKCSKREPRGGKVLSIQKYSVDSFGFLLFLLEVGRWRNKRCVQCVVFVYFYREAPCKLLRIPLDSTRC